MQESREVRYSLSLKSKMCLQVSGKLCLLKLSTPTTIGNCRSLPASPTTVDVVYNMLINVEIILLNLGQTDPCVTVDELVYKLVKIVQWNMWNLSFQELSSRRITVMKF